MKKITALLLTLFITALMSNAQARDSRHMFPLADALGNEHAREKLDGSVQFYFGNSPHSAVLKNYGEFMSNKKTNAFNKTDKFACEWAFLTAMLSFQQRAKSFGANAVINIQSYYKKNAIHSSSEYECGAGGVIAGVTFKGEVVKLGGGQASTAKQNNSMQTESTQSNKVLTAQKLLGILGFDPGPADGTIGNKTMLAISEYQKQQGIPVTGKLDDATLTRMNIQ